MGFSPRTLLKPTFNDSFPLAICDLGRALVPKMPVEIAERSRGPLIGKT
jgi:hypothetical protein